MIKKILSKYNFEQLNNFYVQIEPEIIESETTIEYLEYSTQWIDIKTKLKNGIELKILINSNDTMERICFYFKSGILILEQIIFTIINNSEYEFDHVICHDYFTLDNDIATTFNSGYRYLNKKYIDGWEYERKLNFKYIERYAGIDNLANFQCIIDNGDKEILYKSDNSIKEEKEINSVMFNKKGEAYIRALKKAKELK